MKRTFEYQITPAEDGIPAGAFLLSRGYSRHLLIDLKKTSVGLTIDGHHIHVTHRLRAGEILTVTMPVETGSPTIASTPMELDIVYEDEDILVINKAKDTPIHPSQGNFTNTLANGIAWYFEQKGEPFVYRVINRLDRDTTGLLILAKNPLSACILSDMMRSHSICRTYLAAVSGDIRRMSHQTWEKGYPDGLIFSSQTGRGTITAPIARVDGSTIERQVDFSKGEYACTHFSWISYQPQTDTSLLKLQLETGRTHQIRVHMKYLGFPLYGDFLYHPDYRFINRQSLHSCKLSFYHPITKEPLVFTAAVPNDMSIFL